MEVQAKESFWKETLKLVILALIVVIPFRIYIAQPFIVEGASMDPTFKSGQYLIVDKLTYQFEEPERGSVLIFKYPKNPKKYFIKRVIGLPGETVMIQDGKVTIINSDNPEGFTLKEPYIRYSTRENLTAELNEGQYFVLGDNRQASADSRVWGPVPDDNIIGRPVLRLFPPAVWPGNTESALTAQSK